MPKRHTNLSVASWRYYFIYLLLAIVLIALTCRLIFLGVYTRPFLVDQGAMRAQRIITQPAYRGMITDRNDKPLAVSSPMPSIWVDPIRFKPSSEQSKALAGLLYLPENVIQTLHSKHPHRQFLYLKRLVEPKIAQAAMALHIPGLALMREYKRFYPLGASAAQIIGMTNIDDIGHAGLEYEFNQWLKGHPGKKHVIIDRYGHVVSVLKVLKKAAPGRELQLSLDRRLQFLAYSVLNDTVTENKARSGSVVILNPKTGEVLAMANVPSFNPNAAIKKVGANFRNRAVTDVFEPGSTMKAFSVASALDSGKYSPDSVINTGKGWFKVEHNWVRDDRLNGKITVQQVLQRSSNVGVAKMTLSLPPEQLWSLMHRVGFGTKTTSGFPGERSGNLVKQKFKRPFVLATLAFGYGLSITSLQLAQAYAIIANHGIKMPVTFLKRQKKIIGNRVMDAKVADQMLQLLHTVLRPGGTGTKGRVANYEVAGKTGTAHIAARGGYLKNDYVASFAGIAPLYDPQLVVVVVIHDPHGKSYYGGPVAGPAFAKIMGRALAILDIPPATHT